jgi:predicted transcriptional regulator
MNLFDSPDVSAEKLQSTVEGAVNGLKLYKLLKTSIELEIFDILTKKTTCRQLSEKLGIEPLLVHYILEILVKIGLAKKNGEAYRNTRLSEIYLNSSSDYKRTDCITSLEEDLSLWNNLASTLKGKIVKKDEAFFPRIVQVMAEDCLSGELQETVKLIASYNEFKGSKTLLDLAGGHGMYSIAFNQIKPDLKCYVFDLPAVLEETSKFIENYESNVKTIPGNFYTDDFGDGYDTIFSSYNPGGKNPKIAEKVYRSLNLGGLFVNKQYFPEKGKSSLGDLLDNLEWNFTNFGKSNKAAKRFTFKDDMSLGEYMNFLEELGFVVMDVYPINHLNITFGTRSEDKIIVAKKVR